MIAWRAGATAGCTILLLPAVLGGAGFRASPQLPFGPGEELAYRMRVSPFGTIGRAVLRVGGPEVLRGVEVYTLHFDTNARVGPLSASQHSRSWLDPQRFATLRYVSREKQPLSREVSEAVEVYPENRSWMAADGRTGESPTDDPLDELSFLYFVRTLPLTEEAETTVVRHFDPKRNPIRVRVVGRKELRVPAGTFQTVVIDLRVRDPERHAGYGRVRLHLSDDPSRTPVRIETALPDIGTTVLELESVRLASSAR